MAKKKRASIAGMLVEAVSDIANAASVAATGSEIGVFELAAEPYPIVQQAYQSCWQGAPLGSHARVTERHCGVHQCRFSPLTWTRHLH
jgi:hypothetical protein